MSLRRAIGLGGAVLAAARASAEDPSGAAVRYDLRPGDHLVYRQRLDREVKTPTGATTTHGEWTSHLLVLAESGDLVQVGIQRNRTSLRVLRLREDGKERGEPERRALEERLGRRDAAFSEANWVDPAGQAAVPWSVLRETVSELLPHLHEIEPFPAGGSDVPAATWTRAGALPMTMRTAAAGSASPADCPAVEGTLKDPPLHLRVRRCGGVVERLEFEGDHRTPPNREVHEALVLDLVERKRAEDVSSWLAQPDLRRGVLAAMFTSTALPVPAASLAPLLDTGDVGLQRQVLAFASRCRPGPLPASRLAPLLESPSPRVRALAVRNLASAEAAVAAPLLARVEHDPDEAVRRAVRSVTTAERADEALIRQARAVRGGGPLPTAATCGGLGWAEKALQAQRALPAPPGTVVLSVRAGPFAGLPYVVRVPEDYRGDEPFPLLVYLSGGPGRAMSGVLESADVVDETGWLVVYPQAQGMWWEGSSTAAFPAIVHEVLSTLNVDPNRVFLAGFSNGGTGALSYAALWPDRWAAVAPLMGGGFPFFGPEPPPAANLSRLPMLFLHGDADAVIAPSATRETVRSLKHDYPQANVEMEILKGRGHDVRLGSDGPRVLAFLAGQARDPFPRRLVFETRDLEHGRSHWVEVLAKKPGLARVEAALDDDGTIRVDTRRVNRLRLLLRREMLPRPELPVRVVLDGRDAFAGPVDEDCGRLLASWRATGDPFLAHSAEIALEAR